MLGRQAFLDAIKNNTCGVMIRELVPGTLQVYPIKGYGAIEMGIHRFHHPGHEKEFPAAKQLGMTRFLDPGRLSGRLEKPNFYISGNSKTATGS